MADSSDILFFHPRCADLDDSQKGLLFDPEKLKHAGLVSRELKGRGTTYFFKLKEQSCVLRHYWRGGFMQNLSKDAYFWLGLNRTRSCREWKLLEQMEKLDLPAPRGVALRIQRQGLCYRSDIVTEEIEGVESFAQILQQRSATEAEWQRVGQTIRLFHDHHIFHQDLNANNLLLRDNAFYLIDFDRGRIQKGSGWQERVIARLKRSLKKLKGKHDPFYFTENGWAQLLQGYEKS